MLFSSVLPKPYGKGPACGLVLSLPIQSITEKGCEAHATYMVENGDRKALKQLKINLTCEPKFKSDVEVDNM